MTTEAPSPPSAASSEIPPAASDRSAWAALGVVLDGLVDPSSLSADHFAPEFLAQVPIERVRSIFTSLGVGEWKATSTSPPAAAQLVAHLTGPGAPQVMHVAVDGTGRMAELVFQPDLLHPPANLQELTERLAAVGETAAYLRADISADGSCERVAELDADRVVPLGSTFKLYVLGAVASAIEQGRMQWDTEVTIRDELDSLPSGVTQDGAAGSSLSVREVARRMIEISDNTATDHLIDLVGREAVETVLADYGHSDPRVTMPFLTTREAFIIKADEDLLSRYQAGDEAERRALLDDEVAAAELPPLEALGPEPRAATTVEWFASPADVCRALVNLHTLSARPGLEPVGEILGANPGVIIDRNEFPTVWFKGGSEPGVLFAAWLTERPDGSRVLVAGGAADTTTSIEQDPTLIQLLARGLSLPEPGAAD